MTDQYISTLTHHCGQGNEDDVITNINDVRNGLYLSLNSHVILGNDAAFLMTPNFAMDTDDVNDTAEPNERMCTAHVIKPHDEKFPPNLITGSRLRISNSPQFPPDILFNALYAGFVLHHFGTEAMGASITTKWKHLFYPDGPMTTANIGDEANIDDRSYAAIMARRRPEERVYTRYERRRQARLE
ncbi:hypothetical protein EI94DRAFT_410790, partial [Lactarius quietus]